MKYRQSLFVRPTVGGSILGLVSWWLSLPPTLLPRTWLTQGVISAICLAVGYMVGTYLGFLVHWVMDITHHEFPTAARTWTWRAVLAAWAVMIVASLIFWTIWQNEQNELVQLPSISPLWIVAALILTVVLTALLFFIGRSFHHGVTLIDHFFVRHGSPRYLADILTTAVVIVLVYGGVNWVLAPSFTTWANDKFGAGDETTAPGVDQPNDPKVSGSPDSYAAWDTLGLEGRTFVAQPTSMEDLQEFDGPGASVKAPIRVYAGIDTAAEMDDRAAVVVQELERTDAFSREILVVFTATGTGWVDPAAASSLEYMHAGDTAIASMQYSFFPSWISFLIDRDQAALAGNALYKAIHARWLEEPEATRPRLIVFGQSLGSFGAETPFVGPDVQASVNDYVDGADGFFFTGPTDFNEIWQQLTAAREPGSPSWRPVYDNGTTVQLINQTDDLDGVGSEWKSPRVLYVHHPSDPVGYWNWQTLWSSPSWVDHPVGYDVPSGVRWWPFVTWVQTIGDLVQGFSAPSGYGHNYTNAFIGGWNAVAPADAWTDADSARLAKHLGHED